MKLLPSNRIKCDITGHELPLKPDAIQSHVKGKKFKKSLEWYNYDYSEFLPYIVPHKRDPKKLFCLLTRQELNKVPEEVKKHIQGKRFERYIAYQHHKTHALNNSLFVIMNFLQA